MPMPSLSPSLVIVVIFTYFAALLFISWLTSRKADSFGYFLGNKKSPWFVVAFGLLGDSLSGITFISVPGAVLLTNFGYLQVVFGYFFGYMVISQVLLPLYYKLNLTSIYSFLGKQLGQHAAYIGSFYFIISRLVGAAGRLFIASTALHIFVFGPLNIPLNLSIAIVIGLILGYTFKGGIKTLVWTDFFQSFFLLLGVVLSIAAILQHWDISISTAVQKISQSQYAKIFEWDINAKGNFFKSFIGGIFIAASMSGMDQNMMQKNLSCKSLGEAQKNMYTFSFVMLFVNVFFLALGALLYLYADAMQLNLPMDENTGKIITDKVFPTMALGSLGVFAGIAFILGLTAATFSSADSVLATLTTSFCIDFLKQNTDQETPRNKKIRQTVHISFAIILLVLVIGAQLLSSKAMIDQILTLAGYTYGPLIGLFSFCILKSKSKIANKYMYTICLLSPMITYFIQLKLPSFTGGFELGHSIIVLNGILTFIGLTLFSHKNNIKYG